MFQPFVNSYQKKLNKFDIFYHFISNGSYAAWHKVDNKKLRNK